MTVHSELHGLGSDTGRDRQNGQAADKEAAHGIPQKKGAALSLIAKKGTTRWLDLQVVCIG